MSATANLELFDGILDNRTGERLADALRRKDIDAFNEISPYAACLLPLLSALGWQNFGRDLIEALPHHSDSFDIVDLRNVLVSLGYDSTVQSLHLNQLNRELTPCLFLANNGSKFIVLEIDEEEALVFDVKNQEQVQIPLRHQPGTAYLFTDLQPTHEVLGDGGKHKTWFAQLMERFKSMLMHVLVTTFFINMITLSVPLFIMLIYDKVIGARSLDTLPMLVLGVGVAILTDLGLRIIRAQKLGAIAGRLDYLVGTEVFRQILYLPPQFTERATLTTQIARLKQFDSIRDLFVGPTAASLLELPFVMIFVFVIAIIGGWLALVPVVMVILYGLFAVFWLPKLNHDIARTGKVKHIRNTALIETIAGRREIKAIAAEENWSERFRETSGDAETIAREMEDGNAVLNSVAQTIMSLSGAAILGFGALAVMNQSMTVGALIATMALSWRVLAPLQSLFLSYSRHEQVFATIKQINQLMQRKVERVRGRSSLLLPKINGRVKFENVSFRYTPQDDPSLLGVNFDIAEGEMVAIVGNTGAGKSTILKLIAGMYKPQGGALKIDNADLRQFNAIELRRSISYVPQKHRLFHGTIAQNLRLNNVLATDEELRFAADKAGILKDIEAFPDGFETQLGDHASERLPRGFARSLTMARAYARNAPIILLDEPGAGLDPASDELFMRNLATMKGEHTIIMASHRPSHIRLADRVILLQGGSVAFNGDPDKALDIVLGNKV